MKKLKPRPKWFTVVVYDNVNSCGAVHYVKAVDPKGARHKVWMMYHECETIATFAGKQEDLRKGFIR